MISLNDIVEKKDFDSMFSVALILLEIGEEKVFEKGDREIFKKGLVVGDPETRKSI